MAKTSLYQKLRGDITRWWADFAVTLKNYIFRIIENGLCLHKNFPPLLKMMSELGECVMKRSPYSADWLV
jgi:hypothetical protein